MSRGLLQSLALGTCLLGATFSCGQEAPSLRGKSTGQRYVAPYPNDVSALKAEEDRLKVKESQVLGSKKRYDQMKGELDADFKSWQRERDANERFGKQRSSGEAHDRNYKKYWDTRRRLERQRNQFKDREARLEQSGRGIETDLSAVRERLRRNQERLAALSGRPRSSGRDYSYDEDAPKSLGK
jgi:predicted  nucleic acid-binding Zn-ribbon protein